MTRPFKKMLLRLLLILLTLAGAVAVSAQQLENSLQQAREAGISEATLKRLLALAYEKQLEPAGMANLLPVLAQCQRENLPLEPFLSKIEEGISKRVPASRIGQVLKTRLDDYRFTRSLLAQGVGSGSEIDAAATVFHIRLTETLYCGLSREDLTHLAGIFPSASLPALSRGAEVLATLKQLRLTPQLADQIVATGIEQGYFAVEQRDFGRLVAMAKKKGLADTQIAAAALEVMKSNGSQNDLSSRLGITSQDGAHEGPHLEKTAPASGLSGRKESALAPTIGGVGKAGELQEQANASREGGSVVGLEAVPTVPMLYLIGPPDGSTPVPRTAGTDLMLAAEVSKAARAPKAAANPSAVKASDSAPSPSPTPSRLMAPLLPVILLRPYHSRERFCRVASSRGQAIPAKLPRRYRLSLCRVREAPPWPYRMEMFRLAPTTLSDPAMRSGLQCGEASKEPGVRKWIGMGTSMFRRWGP